MKSDKITVYSPGRACLFGDHQDYLGLPVIACAIDRYIKITAIPNDQNRFELDLPDLSKKRTIHIDECFETLEKRDYFAAALRVLRREKCVPERGYDIRITGNIPINSGTSSSSALLLGWIQFLVTAFSIKGAMNPERLAYLGYASEVLEHSEPGGMMDHYSIGVGGIVHITTQKPFTCTQIKNDRLSNALITGVSGVKKDTVGLIGTLKSGVFKALEIVKKHHPDFVLERATVAQITHYEKVLPQYLQRFFRAAIENHLYTQEALKVFKEKHTSLSYLGTLMNQHHKVLKELLQITVPKIDAMIEASLQAGACGAKIVGSGGGGSIVVIAPPEKHIRICEAIKLAGAKDAYPVNISNGTFLKEG